MEWELSNAGMYDDTKLNANQKYDRAEIYKKDTLSVTIEDFNIRDYFENISEKQMNASCKYNVEISIGVLGKTEEVSLENFLTNDDVFLSEVRDDVNEFVEFFVNDPNIRLQYDREYIQDSYINTENHFLDCHLSQPFTARYKNKNSYPVFYQKGPSYDYNDEGELYLLDMGRPQITLGLSYALFVPLLKYLNEVVNNNPVKNSLSNYNTLNIDCFDLTTSDSIRVCEGFGMVIIYFSTVAAEYIQTDVGKKYGVGSTYFKSTFLLKPRSNLAESYKYLKEEYPQIVGYIINMRKSLISELENYGFDIVDIERVKDYDSLVHLHLDFIRGYVGDPDILRKIEDEKYEDVTDKYQDVIAYMISTDNSDYKNVSSVITFINAYYLIYQLFNPRKVVKLSFDRKRIKKGCKILDGYYYSYEGQNKELIDELVSKGQVRIINNRVYDYSHTSDPPLLVVDRPGRVQSICSSRREELFEYIPEDSNLIIEVRTPEDFTQNQDDNGIHLHKIEDFLSRFFQSIKNIFTEFLYG
jgi:hypothetical protein